MGHLCVKLMYSLGYPEIFDFWLHLNKANISISKEEIDTSIDYVTNSNNYKAYDCYNNDIINFQDEIHRLNNILFNKYYTIAAPIKDQFTTYRNIIDLISHEMEADVTNLNNIEHTANLDQTIPKGAPVTIGIGLKLNINGEPTYVIDVNNIELVFDHTLCFDILNYMPKFYLRVDEEEYQKLKAAMKRVLS